MGYITISAYQPKGIHMISRDAFYVMFPGTKGSQPFRSLKSMPDCIFGGFGGVVCDSKMESLSLGSDVLESEEALDLDASILICVWIWVPEMLQVKQFHRYVPFLLVVPLPGLPCPISLHPMCPFKKQKQMQLLTNEMHGSYHAFIQWIGSHPTRSQNVQMWDLFCWCPLLHGTIRNGIPSRT